MMIFTNGDQIQYEIDNAGVAKELRSDWPWPSFDAMDWAKALSSRFGMSVDDALPWMACALMRGYDEHASRVAADVVAKEVA